MENMLTSIIDYLDEEVGGAIIVPMGLTNRSRSIDGVSDYVVIDRQSSDVYCYANCEHNPLVKGWNGVYCAPIELNETVIINILFCLVIQVEKVLIRKSTGLVVPLLYDIAFNDDEYYALCDGYDKWGEIVSAHALHYKKPLHIDAK